jgi:hypothetical protein
MRLLLELLAHWLMGLLLFMGGGTLGIGTFLLLTARKTTDMWDVIDAARALNHVHHRQYGINEYDKYNQDHEHYWACLEHAIAQLDRDEEV